MSKRIKHNGLLSIYVVCLLSSIFTSTICSFILILISMSISSYLLYKKTWEIHDLEDNLCGKAKTCKNRIVYKKEKVKM